MRFAARGGGGALEIGRRGAALRRAPVNGDGSPRPAGELTMRLAGAAAVGAVRGERRLPGRVHYLRGNEPRRWRRNLPTYAAVRCDEVYPGIDLIYYGGKQELEYDFQVAPGADPGAIRLELTGAVAASLDARGDLVLADASGAEARHRRPVAYQEVNGARRAVAAEYRLEGGGAPGQPYQVAFHLAEHDPSHTLIIDPVVVYSTYFGGGGGELTRGAGIALDALGNAYLAGDTESSSLPGADDDFSGGRRDAFVTKLNPAGTAVMYTTYLGGSDSDVARGIAVDGDGQVSVVGETFSSNFPTANAHQPALRGFPGSDAFITKLDPTGAELVYSTYLGGTTGSDSAAGVALDNAGNAWVAGSTGAPDFPRVAALQAGLAGGVDAFVAAFSASGDALLFSTHLGGGGTDRAAAIAVAPGGAVAVAGGTESANFPTLGAVQGAKEFGRDAFVTLLAPGAASVTYSTFLGGSGVDAATGVALDPTGAAAVTGFTGSGDFPTVNPRQAHYGGRSDAFVARFTPGGESLVYSTYLGGNGTENNGSLEAGAIAVDAAGSAFVTGYTSSRNFPLIGASQKRFGGRTDAFLTRFSPDGGELLYSTFLGGKLDDLGMALAIDANENAFVAGQTTSKNFPLRYPSQQARAGASDAFVAKLGSVDASVTPLLVLSRVTLEFPSVRPGLLALQPLRIANGGRARLICSVGAPEAPFSILTGGGDFSLGPRKERRVFVQFKPTAPGEYTALVELLTNDPYRPSTMIRLRGASPAPEE